ncbi:MAG: DNA topoisomerase VI subunit B [Hadesarchaea archaeon]|nr:MAG: DNA topoisomerase VI subunit B [Hadesarchaea archaeon]
MKTLADELFEEFREHSVSEFFRKNAAMLGYTGKVRSLTTVVHEGVTNSLDACEEAGILPEIKVEIKRVDEDPEHLKVAVEDNGPGIPEKYIPSVFGKMLAGTKLHRLLQQRGQQGIGISGAVMFAQITSGKPALVRTSTGDGKIVEMEVSINVDKNEGEVHSRRLMQGKWKGTRIELELKEVTYQRSRYSPFHYLKMTSIANPHAKIIFEEPDGTKTVFERVVKEVPPPPEPMPLYPKGLMADDLLVLCRNSRSRTVGGVLIGELSRMTKQKVEEVERLSGVRMDKKPQELTWEEAERIIRAFKQMKFMAPSASGLRPIGKEHIEKSLKQMYEPEFVAAVTREPKFYRGGIPFVVEVGMAYGGKAGREEGEGERMELLRFANRAPLIFDQGGCVITSALRDIDWGRYGLDPENSPLTIFVNLCSAYVPYTSAGKQSIAEEPEIYEELRFAVMDVAREVRSYLYRKTKQREREQRAGIFEKFLPIIAKKASSLAEEEPPDIKPVLKKVTGIELERGE